MEHPGSGIVPSATAAAESRHGAFTPDRQVRFLDALAEHGNVRAACARARISPEAAYRLRRRDHVFAESWKAALVLAREQIEQVLADRALNGVEEEIWYRGELVGSRRRYDSRLLLAHLGRLDRLADEGDVGRRAARFEEMLALVAGERFPRDMLEISGGPHDPVDPLLPMDRDCYVRDAERRAYRDSWWDERDEPAGEDPDMEEDDEVEEIDAEAAYAAAAAEWDDWEARVAAIGAALDAEGHTIASLDSVNSVNIPPLTADACPAPPGPVKPAARE